MPDSTARSLNPDEPNLLPIIDNLGYTEYGRLPYVAPPFETSDRVSISRQLWRIKLGRRHMLSLEYYMFILDLGSLDQNLVNC